MNNTTVSPHLWKQRKLRLLIQRYIILSKWIVNSSESCFHVFLKSYMKFCCELMNDKSLIPLLMSYLEISLQIFSVLLRNCCFFDFQVCHKIALFFILLWVCVGCLSLSKSYLVLLLVFCLTEFLCSLLIFLKRVIFSGSVFRIFYV